MSATAGAIMAKTAPKKAAAIRAAKANARPIPHDDPQARQAKVDEAMRPKKGSIRVMATKVGYYDDKRRRIGDVFTVSAERNEKGGYREFSDKWMERVDEDTPERITTGNEDIRRQHDEILKAKSMGGIHTGPDNPTGGEGVLDDD